MIKPSTDFLVVEPSSGLNVSVGAGHCFIKGSTTDAYPVRNTVATDVAIDANSSGNPRYTAVIVYLDLSATPGANDGGDDVALFDTVNGSPAGSPTAPDDSTIQSTVGAGNPFLRLADVLVANGATGISNANITNTSQRVFLQSPTPIYTLTYASPLAINFLNGAKQKVVMTGSPTISAPTNMEIGDMFKLTAIQDGTGNRTITWFSGITWLSPDTTLAVGANDITDFVIEKTGTATYNGYLAGKEY